MKFGHLIYLFNLTPRSQYADYPGIIPYTMGKALFKDREFNQEERSVRGILVSGLTEADMAALDIFEGTVRTFFCLSYLKFDLC